MRGNKPFTNAQVITAMWSGGRPSNTNEYAKVYRAAVQAGCSHQQAFVLACGAYDASKGYVDKIDIIGSQLRRATLTRRASEPQSMSLYAWLRDKHGAGYLFLTDQQIFNEHNGNFAEWSAWSEQRRADMAYTEATINTIGDPSL